MTWLTTAEAAIYLSKNPHEVRREAFDQGAGSKVPEGRIPAYRLKGRWRFDSAQLDAMVRGESTAAPRRITTRGRRRRAS